MKTINRFSIFYLIISLIFLILLLKLFYLQILRGDYYRTLSDGNRIRIIYESASRGRIFDRNFNILVDNRPSYNVALSPGKIKLDDKKIRKISEYLGVEYEYVKDKTSKQSVYISPINLKEDVNITKLTKLLEDFDLREIIIQVSSERVYNFPNILFHILGYIGEISRERLTKLKDKGYKIGDIIGKDGLELQYDKILRGIDGGSQVEVDTHGRRVRTLGYVSPKPGKDIMLTIDKNLQTIIEEKIQGHVGAIVIMNPNNGEILALTSSISLPSDFFSKKIDSKTWQKVISHPQAPFQNRAIGNKYPPGSIFKIVTVSAGLETGKISKHSRFFCPGFYKVAGRKFRCWHRSGHGSINLVDSIAQSCDIPFYQMGRMIGVENLAKFAEYFGAGSKSGIDLPGELSGTVPDPLWKLKRFKSPWFPGDTVNMSIGQGFLQATPLQMAIMTGIIANGGYKVRPHIVKGIREGNEWKYTNIEREKIPISDETIKIVKDGMIKTVEKGTGILCKMENLEIGGKTGTAEDPPRKMPHSWFVSFAPADKPEIVMVVFIEGGGKGGEVATPLAKEIYQEIFKDFIN